MKLRAKWNMQIQQNKNTFNEKGHYEMKTCHQIGHIVIKFEKKYYIFICRLWVGPK